MNVLEKPVNFIKEVRQELTKVSWSTREELLGSTMVVITITGIMAVFIFIIDFFLAKILNVVFK